jgi:hypothetical protein
MCLFCNIHGTVESELLARIHGVPVGAVMSLTNLALYGDDGFEAHETELLAMLTADETAAFREMVKISLSVYDRRSAFYRTCNSLTAVGGPVWHLLDTEASGIDINDARKTGRGHAFYLLPDGRPPVRYPSGTKIGIPEIWKTSVIAP